jgi:hypothetical protein
MDHIETITDEENVFLTWVDQLEGIENLPGSETAKGRLMNMLYLMAIEAKQKRIADIVRRFVAENISADDNVLDRLAREREMRDW